MNKERVISNVGTIITSDKFSNICRLCLNSNNLKPIFKLKYKDLEFHRIFEMCTSVHIEEEDDLPQNICFVCFNEMIRFYTLRLKAQEINGLLKNLSTNFANVECSINDDSESCSSEKVNDNFVEEMIDIKEEYTNEYTVHKEIQSTEEEIEERDDTQSTSIAEPTQPQNYQKYNCKTFVNLNQYLVHCKLFNCPYCGISFKLHGNFKKHLRGHTGGAMETCGNDYQQSTQLTEEHTMDHIDKKPYLCSDCGKIFATKTSFEKHVHEEFKESEHTCDICNENFYSVSDFEKHTEQHGERKYLCTDCGKAFYTEVGLQKHSHVHLSFKKILQGEKRFQCTDCGKKLATRASFREHSKLHSGIRPHTCKVCNKTFAQSGNLTLHTRVHTGEKPYVCKTCNQSFKQPQHLKYHSRIHSGERPYVCNYCEKSFALKGTLTVHVRTHTKETPYICDVCGKGFYDNSSMSKHRKARHKESLFKVMVEDGQGGLEGNGID